MGICDIALLLGLKKTGKKPYHLGDYLLEEMIKFWLIWFET